MISKTDKMNSARDFTLVDNGFINDERLSWKAKGIMLYLLSHPDDWEFRKPDFINGATDGEASFDKGLQELKELGYVEHNKTHDGRIKWEIIVHEKP